MIEAREVLADALLWGEKLPLCVGRWGALTDDEDAAVGFLFKKEVDPPAQIVCSVMARDLGRAVCAEGLVAVAAWDLSDGHLPTAVELYLRALSLYVVETGNAPMSADHDDSTYTKQRWDESLAYRRMVDIVYEDTL